MTWLLVLVFSVSLVLSSLLMVRIFVKSSLESFDLHLNNHAIDVSASVDFDFLVTVDEPAVIMRNRSYHQVLQFHKSFLQISTVERRIVSKSANLADYSLPLSEREVKELNTHDAIYETLSSKTLPVDPDHPTQLEEFRLISTHIIRPPLSPLILQIAAPLNVIERSKTSLLKYLFVMIPVTILVSILFGIYFSNQALVPMTTMIGQAKRIERGELSERIPVPANDPELAKLATTLNQLLDRLIKTLSTQQRFIGDASHQLKTPLTIMKLQLTQKSPSLVNQGLRDQLDNLIRLTDNLLALAQIDAEKRTDSYHQFRFDEFLLEVIPELEKLAAQKSIRITTNFFPNEELTESFVYNGDSLLLKQMVFNLIVNAIKYSPRETAVKVDLRDSKGSIVLGIRDQGPGIPADEKTRIFDRFYRGKLTTPKTAGTGLGLSIAKSIAELHDGTIEITESSPGTEFRISLPKHSV